MIKYTKVVIILEDDEKEDTALHNVLERTGYRQTETETWEKEWTEREQGNTDR